MAPLRVGFIGAGEQAMMAHYPCLAKLQHSGEIELAAICELDSSRLERACRDWGTPSTRRYTDHRRMLHEAALDAVYIVTQPPELLPVVLDALAAHSHVFMEKPPGISVAQTEQMVESAQRAGRWAAVGLQRRFTAVVREALRRINQRGPLTMCLAEFHKDFVTDNRHRRRPPSSTLLRDVIHVVDLCRFVCGATVDESPETHVLHGHFGGAVWPICYNALLRFASGAQAVISANRSSGGRLLRVELHGAGISCYIDRLPDAVRIVADDGREDSLVTGAELAGSDDELSYEGVLDMHRDFVACIRDGRQPLTDVREVIATMRLVERLESPYWAD